MKSLPFFIDSKGYITLVRLWVIFTEIEILKLIPNDLCNLDTLFLA